MHLAKSLQKRVFVPGITDVLWVTKQGSPELIAIDISDVSDPVFKTSVSYGVDARDAFFDPSGASYGPLFSGLFTFSNLIYVCGYATGTMPDEIVVAFDTSNPRSVPLATNGRYETNVATFDARALTVDVTGQYMYLGIDDTNNYIASLKTWDTAVSGAASTEGMISSSVLDTLSVPGTFQDINGMAHDDTSKVIYTAGYAGSDSSQPGIIWSVDASDPSSLTTLDTISISGFRPQTAHLLLAADNAYSSSNFLFTGGSDDTLYRINVSSPSAMTNSGSLAVGHDVNAIVHATDSSRLYVCGNGKVSTISNALSGGTMALSDTLDVGGSSLYGITYAPSGSYGTDTLFVSDLTGNKIYVVSAASPTNLTLLHTWDYTSIGAGSSAFLDNPKKLFYQNLV